MIRVKIKNGLSAFYDNLFRPEGSEFTVSDRKDVDGKTIKAEDQISKTMEVLDKPRKKRAVKGNDLQGNGDADENALKEADSDS